MACKVALRRSLAAVPTAARDVNGLTRTIANRDPLLIKQLMNNEIRQRTR